MSPYPSWQPGYCVSCCSIWSDFGSGSYCLSHPPFQISVDPNVWVLESTTCFLVRCQGNTLQEQRTRGRGATAEVQMRATSPALIFFFLQAFFKSRCSERNLNLQERKAPRLYQYVQEKESNTSKHIGRRKKTKKGRKKTDSSLEYRKHVFPLQLALTRCSLHESMLFN